MKRLWIAAALLAVILVGTMFNGWALEKTTSPLLLHLEQAADLARRGQWEGAEATTRQALAEWQDHYTYFHTILRHSDINEVQRQFSVVLKYLEVENIEEYCAANADLMTRIGLLAEMERASLANVL